MSYTEFFKRLSSSVIILFMGGFLLSRAVTKHGIDQAIAARLLKPFTKSPLLLLYGVLGISGFFFMWMSNTATAAMMVAIITPVILHLREDSRFAMALPVSTPLPERHRLRHGEKPRHRDGTGRRSDLHRRAGRDVTGL